MQRNVHRWLNEECTKMIWIRCLLVWLHLLAFLLVCTMAAWRRLFGVCLKYVAFNFFVTVPRGFAMEYFEL